MRQGLAGSALALVAVAGVAAPAGAVVVLCKRNQSIKLREGSCKKKETAISASELGVTGPPGADGAPGELRIYGDGSAGALTVTGSQFLTDLAPDANLQFASVTIAAGASLTVPSGTILRCAGTFTNDGAITVGIGAGQGGFDALSTTAQIIPRGHGAHPGVAYGAAGGGGMTTAVGWEAGGAAGLLDAARYLLRPGAVGGGGGFLGPRGGGGYGGGSFTVLAHGAITNRGTITADAGDGLSFGASGGGGGFVVLASATQISHAAGAHLSAHGGAGGNAGDEAAISALIEYSAGPGGGGGGGCVHLLAPSVTNAGAVDVSGGAAGAANTVTLRTYRVGGSGGGASCGSGGGGGRMASATPGTATAGTDGRVFVTVADPTGLF